MLNNILHEHTAHYGNSILDFLGVLTRAVLHHRSII